MSSSAWTSASATAPLVAEVARVLRRRRLGGEPGAGGHRHPQRVVGAELDPVERLARPRRARAAASPSRVGELGLERAEHAEVLRLARVDRQLGGARQMAARRLALVAPERQLGVAQAGVELGVAAREAPPRQARRAPRSAASQSPASNAYWAIASESQTWRVGSEPSWSCAARATSSASPVRPTRCSASLRFAGGEAMSCRSPALDRARRARAAAPRRPRRSRRSPTSDTPSALSAPA